MDPKGFEPLTSAVWVRHPNQARRRIQIFFINTLFRHSKNVWKYIETLQPYKLYGKWMWTLCTSERPNFSKYKGMWRMWKGKDSLGCIANVSNMWSCRLLWFLSGTARNKTFQRNRTSCHGCTSIKVMEMVLCSRGLLLMYNDTTWTWKMESWWTG